MTRLEQGAEQSNNNSIQSHSENLSQSVWLDAQTAPRNQTAKDQFQSTMSAADPFESTVVFNFDKMDKNGNGRVSISEVDHAIAHGNYTGGNERERLPVPLPMTLKNLYGKSVVDPEVGFTKDELIGFSRSPKSGVKECFSSMSWFDSQRTQPAERQGLKLYTSSPEASIKPEAANQGFVGDCTFIAAISSMSNTPLGRKQIDNMITENKDGTYTVKFPGANRPLTVDAPTSAEHVMYANGHGNGMWANVLEKAYGKYSNNEAHWFPSLFGTTIQAQALDGGLVGSIGMKLLTNSNAEVLQLGTMQKSQDGHMVPAEKEDVITALSHANTDGFIVTASLLNEKNSLGLPSNHEYSILKFDTTNREVTMRNPWGSREPRNASGAPLDGKDDGIFKVSLEQFQSNFSDIEWSKIQENK